MSALRIAAIAACTEDSHLLDDFLLETAILGYSSLQVGGGLCHQAKGNCGEAPRVTGYVVGFCGGVV
jgi:hypothetical protein